MDAIARGSNVLAVLLYKALATNWKNTFFSPFSILSVLSMLMYGAKEDTESELRNFLSFGNVEKNALANSFEMFMSSLNEFPNDYTIFFANSLVVDRQFDVMDQYTSDLSKFFNALCIQADFANDSSAAVDQINKWVREKTNGMVPKLLESLDSNTVMVLLNAVYFKGLWLEQFQEKSTVKHYFYNQGREDNAKLVDMMHLKKSFMWFETQSFQALQLPYKGEEIAMLIFLPNSREGLKEMEELMTPTFISETMKHMGSREIQVALPKFRFEYSTNLKEILQDLGVKRIFQWGADFSGISNCKNLAVSQVIHKAVFEVNEEGCKAAAATVAKIRMRSIDYSPEFIVNHPFAFVIYNLNKDIVLFMGKVTEL